MADLDSFGRARPNKQMARAKSGGVKSAGDVHAYRTPHGPTSLGNRGPGLGGQVFAKGTQGVGSIRTGSSGRPGLGGSTHKSGSQKC